MILIACIAMTFLTLRFEIFFICTMLFLNLIYKTCFRYNYMHDASIFETQYLFNSFLRLKIVVVADKI